MFVITFVNSKGGVGKTTSATSVAVDLALRGKRVLLIDADPRRNATKIFTDPEGVRATLADVLLSNGPRKGRRIGLDEAATATEVKGLDLVPASDELTYFDQANEGQLSVMRLRNSLEAVAARYDFAVIDTPTNIGMLLSASLAAANGVVIPVQAEPLALDGIGELLDVIDSAKEANRELKVLGALCTMLDDRLAVGREVFAALREQFPGRTFLTAIHRQVRLSECAAAHRPIQLHAPSSRGAEEYHALGDELLAAVGRNGNGKARRAKRR